MPKSNRTRLKALELENWPAKGHSAHFTVEPGRTVFVGRNGAGKSLLLEGLSLAARVASRPVSGRSFILEQPSQFTFRFDTPLSEESINFSCDWTAEYVTGIGGPAEPDSRVVRREKCWLNDSKKVVWQVSGGIARVTDGPELPIAAGSGLMSLDPASLKSTSNIAYELRGFLQGIRRLGAGIPRQGSRQFVFTQVGRPSNRIRPPGDRIERLASRLLQAKEKHPETFNEFEAVAKQVGIAHQVGIEVFQIRSSSESEKPEFASVHFDGVNIGLLSDGTLRTAEIIWILLTLGENDLFIVEEPETSIHPGLLARILATIESYCVDKQVLVSTHSLQVVNWAKPDEIRLVEQINRKIAGRKLTTHQLKQVASYLYDAGTLGDFVYSGGSDE